MKKIDNIIAGKKVTERVRMSSNLITQELVQIISKIDYELFQHQDFKFDSSKPIFTIILTMHDANIKYIEHSLAAVFDQTYSNTEIIIVNNGAHGAVGDLAWNTFSKHKNAKYIRTPKNLYNPYADLLHNPIFNLWNAALFCSQGDFIYCLSYDDFVSKNYAECMTELFVKNENCFTASPLVVSVNELNETNDEISNIFKNKNKRDRYTNGVELAQDYIRGGNKLLFPGGLFVTRTNLVINCGAFDCMSDFSQIFKFGIHGDSGFNPDAQLFWRHHSEQTNKFQSTLGLVYYESHKAHHEVYQMRQLHLKVANEAFADEYENFLERESRLEALNAFRKSYRMSLISGFSALVRILKECPGKTIALALFYTAVDFPVVIFFKIFGGTLKKLSQWRTARIFYRKLRGRSTYGL
jgi:hypothetical protein